jgi:hypothetical protein
MRSGDIPSLSDWLGLAPLSKHHHIMYRVYKNTVVVRITCWFYRYLKNHGYLILVITDTKYLATSFLKLNPTENKYFQLPGTWY